MAAQGKPPFFQDIPFTKRWGYLKSVIRGFYIDQDLSAREVAQRMKEYYHFDALEHQYKYYLRKWEITKKVPSKKKDDVIIAIGKRTRDINSSLAIKYHGEEVDKKKLRRHINSTEKAKLREEQGLQLSNTLFTQWNLPYMARQMSTATRTSRSSTFVSTPSDLFVGSPHPTAHLASTDACSPSNAPSPTMLAIRGKTLNERAFLFAKGEHEQLFSQLEPSEERILTTWLYHFWLFSFKTAKHWGHGPQDWTAELLEFERYEDREELLSAYTPTGCYVTTPQSPSTQNPSTQSFVTKDSYVEHEVAVEPSILCRWSVHAALHDTYKTIDPTDLEYARGEYITKDGESWQRWPADLEWQLFDDKIQHALQTNSFSYTKLEDLPIDLSQIARISRQSPTQLLQEAFSFSIIARNDAIFWKLLSRIESKQLENTGFYPFHLATSYIDGAKTCCNILDACLSNLCDPWKLYTNDHGHTILDNLFIAILKGHTSCLPVTVDDAFRDIRRFNGEEVDTCGRWDADSACVRNLYANGNASIPFEWKHPFCHTATQAIIHCIGRIAGPCWVPDINTPSGLFLKRCTRCFKSLRFLPLHSLVLIAFHLARSGCKGETLFGILACLVCLLVNGANPLLEAHISLEVLTGTDLEDECSHKDLDPLELAEQVPETLMESWTEEVRLGWQVFCTMLSFARDECKSKSTGCQDQESVLNRDKTEGFVESLENLNDSPSTEVPSGKGTLFDKEKKDHGICQHHKDYTNNFYGGSKTIGTLWAAIQTELLTYRRLKKGDPWISENFNMNSLLEGLQNGGNVSVRLVENDMMNPYCQCGRFLDVDDEACVCVNEACSFYFSNLENWDRTSYILIPEAANYSWYK